MRPPIITTATLLTALAIIAALAGCAPHTTTPGDAAYRSPEQGDIPHNIPKGNNSPEESHFGDR